MPQVLVLWSPLSIIGVCILWPWAYMDFEYLCMIMYFHYFVCNFENQILNSLVLAHIYCMQNGCGRVLVIWTFITNLTTNKSGYSGDLFSCTTKIQTNSTWCTYHKWFSIVIDIWWKFHCCLIKVVEKWLLFNFTQGTAVMACVRFVSDMMPYYEVTLNPIFHWIWITMEKIVHNMGHRSVVVVLQARSHDLAGLHNWWDSTILPGSCF